MFGSASQHLTIYSPSSTTISYTVSTALPRSTRPSRILFVLGNVCRIILCFFVLTVDIVKLQSLVKSWPFTFINFYDMAAGRMAMEIVKSVDWRFLAIGSFLVLYLCLRKGYTGEVVRSTAHPWLRAKYAQKRHFWFFVGLEYKRLLPPQHIYPPQPPGSYLRHKSRTLSFTKPSKVSRLGSILLS